MFFSSKLPIYARNKAVCEMLIKQGYPNTILSEFINSHSFENANDNSAMLLVFRDQFTQEQIKRIINGCIENDQINYSFGARAKLRNFLIANKNLMDGNEKIQISKLMKINLEDLG
jgi:hypothetical protein